MNRFCSECGHKIDTGQAFCPECGTPQQIPETVENNAPAQRVNPTPVRKPMSFKKKLSFMVVAVLAVVLIGGHQIIKANTSPQQKVDAFLAALYSSDTEAAMAAVTVPDNVDKDEEAYQEFLADQDLDNFKSRMYEAAGGVVEDGITRIVFHEDGTELFRIKESKFIGMYPGIQIEAMPIDVLLVSDFDGAQLQLGDKAIVTQNGELKVGSYLPGSYACPVTLDNSVVEESLELDCEIWGSEDVVLDISIKALAVEIQSNHEDAIVHVNGESTGKSVKELNLVGLLKDGQTVDIFVERTNEKGKAERSEEVTAMAGGMLNLIIYTDDSVAESEDEDKEDEGTEEDEAETAAALDEETLGSFISDFRSAYESSLNNKDFSYIDAYLKEGSIARKELVEFIGDIGDDYYFYEFLVDEAVDFEILKEKAYVTTYEEFDFTNHLDVVTNYTRSKKYEVHLTSDGELEIAEIEIMDTVRDN